MENNITQEENKFKIFGTSIENLSVVYGIFLIIWGLIISLISNSNSITSFIPSILGIPICIFSILAKKIPQRKRLFMHLVVMFGLIVFLGGCDFIRQLINQNLFVNLWADISKIMMSLSGFIFLYGCIRSFIFERNKRI